MARRIEGIDKTGTAGVCSCPVHQQQLAVVAVQTVLLAQQEYTIDIVGNVMRAQLVVVSDLNVPVPQPFLVPRFQTDSTKIIQQQEALYAAVGGGPHFILQGFRKFPYAVSHKIKANFAARTQAFNAVYEGHYVDIFGKWDVMFDAAYFDANNIRNFYGLGNETENEEDDREFYQARLEQGYLAPSLYRNTERGAALRIGTFFQWTNVDETTDRFVNRPQAGVSTNTFDVQTFSGLDLEAILDARDSFFNPTQGFLWTNQAQVNVGLGNDYTLFALTDGLVKFESRRRVSVYAE